MPSKWTKEEESVVISSYDTLSNEEMSELLPGRTPDAVRKRLVVLRLTRGHWHLPKKDAISLPEPTIVDAAYSAGHFDGEGCIRMDSDGDSYKMRVSIKCAYKPVLEKYQTFFGGTVRQNGGTNKPLWDWILSGYYNCLRFIDVVLPYSLEKREQLEVARAYIVRRVEVSVTHAPTDIRDMAKETAHRLKELKRV